MHHSLGLTFLLSIPSLIALIFNLYILINPTHRQILKENIFFNIFFIGILGINSIEFLTISGFVSPNLLFMKLFYIFMILSLSNIFLLSSTLSGIKCLQNKFIMHTTYIFCALLISTIFATNKIIAGFQITPITVTRLPGDYYFVAQIFFAILLISTIVFLVVGSKNKSDNITNKKAKIILFSFSPLIVSLLAVLVMMKLGAHVNATFIIPLTTIFLVLAISNSERKESLYKILLKLPYTTERASYQTIINEIESFLTNTSVGQQSSLKNLTSSLEKHIISMALEISNGSQTQAASLLDTSASSICRKKRNMK